MKRRCVITGTVMDQQGMAVPAVEVTLTQETTGVKLTGRTEASGDCVFARPAKGSYGSGKLVNTRFGQVTGSRSPRTQQLALRFSF